MHGETLKLKNGLSMLYKCLSYK